MVRWPHVSDGVFRFRLEVRLLLISPCDRTQFSIPRRSVDQITRFGPRSGVRYLSFATERRRLFERLTGDAYVVSLRPRLMRGRPTEAGRRRSDFDLSDFKPRGA